MGTLWKPAVTVVFAAASVMAADPLVGTWKFNPSRSKPSADARPIEKFAIVAPDSKSYRRSWERRGGKGPIEVTFVLDGKEQKMASGRSITTSRVDARHVRNEEKQHGRVVEDWTVSPDGKTLTMTRKGTGVTSGRPVDEVLVYERE